MDSNLIKRKNNRQMRTNDFEIEEGETDDLMLNKFNSSFKN